MNVKKPIVLYDSVYLAAMMLCSILYMFLNTGKSISTQLAFLQFLFTVFAFIVFIVRTRREKVGLPIYIYILYSIAQLVPILNWIWCYPTAFSLFSTMKMTLWICLPIHTILIAYGVAMPIVIKRLKTRVSV